MAWWMQLRKEGDWQKAQLRGELVQPRISSRLIRQADCPLAAFVGTGSSCLEDEDIETWTRPTSRCAVVGVLFTGESGC